MVLITRAYLSWMTLEGLGVIFFTFNYNLSFSGPFVDLVRLSLRCACTSRSRCGPSFIFFSNILQGEKFPGNFQSLTEDSGADYFTNF